MKEILISRDSKSKLRVVEISCDWDSTTETYKLKRYTGQFNGKMIEQPVIEIVKGKAKRTISEQATLEFNSHVKKYLDKGYKKISDYLKDEDAFFEIFKAEDFSGTDLEVTLKFDFESAKVFGTLNYKIIIFGFMAPSFSVGLGPIDDALSNITLPTEIAIEGSVWQFPSVDSFEVTKKPVKQDYLDSEKFDLDGTSLNVHTKVATGYTEELDPVTGETVITYEYKPGYSGKIEYSPETANMFTCNPSKDEKLNVNATEVIAYFDGFEIAKLPVNVKHDLPDPADEENHFVSITTDLYTDAKPGYHAIVCDGCGEAHNAQPHIPSPVLDENGQPLVDEEGEIICWTSNNDQTFLKNGTESSICQDCGAVLTRNTFGTADYNDTLANYHFIRVILDYINMLLSIINGAL